MALNNFAPKKHYRLYTYHYLADERVVAHVNLWEGCGNAPDGALFDHEEAIKESLAEDRIRPLTDLEVVCDTNNWAMQYVRRACKKLGVRLTEVKL